MKERKTMKAYKATRNMKCINLTFEVGKTYTFNGKLIMCYQGFHFCKNAMDTRTYYPYNKDFVLIEIDVLGKTIDEGDKSVTNKFTVLRIIPKEEYPELIGITLDHNNNKIKHINPNGDTIQYQYDHNNNLIKQIYSNGDTIQYEYDHNNNLIKQNEYDHNNNKVKEINPNGYTWQYEYDHNNNLIKQINSNGYTWQYEYDQNNNKTKQIYPDGSTYQYEYDNNNNKIKHISPNEPSWFISIQ